MKNSGVKKRSSDSVDILQFVLPFTVCHLKLEGFFVKVSGHGVMRYLCIIFIDRRPNWP